MPLSHDDLAEWTAVYDAEPLAPKVNATADALVQGGEACMWAPFQDSTNFMTATFPRALAVAERLWSPRATRNAGAPLLSRRFQRLCRRD